MSRDICWTCVPGATRKQGLCRNCFMVWYDSGITEADVLAREVRYRKANGVWPFGKISLLTKEQLAEIETLPLPDLIGEIEGVLNTDNRGPET